MQDRFKFRGKRIDNNQWYYGSYLYLHNPPKYDWNGTKHEGKEDTHFIIDEKDVNYGVYPETVGQCTGLKDKHGRLIYDGDIVKVQCNREDKGGLFYKTGIIAYELNEKNDHGHADSSFYLKLNNGMCALFSKEKCEVIGNIYENQELLKEVE